MASEAPLCGMVPQGLAGYDPASARSRPTIPRGQGGSWRWPGKDFGGTLPNEDQLTVPYPDISQDVANEYQELQVEWQAVGISIQTRRGAVECNG